MYVADEQTDLELNCPHMPEGPLLCDASRIIRYIPYAGLNGQQLIDSFYSIIADL